MVEVMGTAVDKQAVRRQLVVLRLFDALLDNDRDRVMSFFAEDSVFEPVHCDQPLQGAQAIWRRLCADTGRIERELLEVSAVDDVVLAERAERYLKDGRWVERRLRSALRVDGCKIREWRDQQH
ncbi:MAG: limonene-1,2-epoxide hydrolase family protein [Spongiibacteraceae bacterium]|jgi:limonene-1,2-epoxide hydrolase|nr:limonene-1,2-epoxide hydrolase family protein [Spongiibacteraceae bacterium]